jgi:Fic family protein
MQNYTQAFEIEYTHNSTAIEGNTLSLMETKVLLEDQVSVGGKRLREIYEIINHNKAYQYIKTCIDKGESLDEKMVKDIHAILMENIMIGGVYCNVDVYISGARHTPPSPNEAYKQVKGFYTNFHCKRNQIGLF